MSLGTGVTRRPSGFLFHDVVGLEDRPGLVAGHPHDARLGDPAAAGVAAKLGSGKVYRAEVLTHLEAKPEGLALGGSSLPCAR